MQEHLFNVSYCTHKVVNNATLHSQQPSPVCFFVGYAIKENELVRWEIISRCLFRFFFRLSPQSWVRGCSICLHYRNHYNVFLRIGKPDRNTCSWTAKGVLIKSQDVDSDEMSFICCFIIIHFLSFQKRLCFNKAKLLLYGSQLQWREQISQEDVSLVWLSTSHTSSRTDTCTYHDQSGVGCKTDSGFIISRIRNKTDKPCKNISPQTSHLFVHLAFIFTALSTTSREWHISYQVTIEISKLSRFSCQHSSVNTAPSLGFTPTQMHTHTHPHTRRAKQTF